MPDNPREHHTIPERGTLTRAPRRARAFSLLLVAVWLAPCQQLARALQLGDIEPRSLLGEPFAARIPLRTAAGEDIGLQCIRIVSHPDAAQGMPLPPRLRPDIETVGSKQWLAIRTPALVTAPVIGLRIEVDCNRQLARNYVVLLNPAPLDRVGVQVDSPSMSRQQAATLPAANTVGGAENTHQRRDNVSAGAPRQATASTRTVTAASPAASGKANRTRDDGARIAQTSARKGAGTRRAGAPAGEFVLRIDAGVLDLSRSAGITEARRELLRAIARLTAPTDDSAAAQLEMNYRIRQLEENLTVLRRTLDQPQAAPVAVALPLPVPAPVPAPAWEDFSPIAASALPLAIGGTLALLGLAVSMRWWRRRQFAAATELESWASEPTLPELKPATAAKSNFSPAPAAPAGAFPAASARAPVLQQIIPPMAAEPPLLTEIAAAAPANVCDLDVSPSPSMQPLDIPLEFSPPGADRSRAAQEEYFAGRFGADSQDIKILHDPDTVIEQARSIYQDDGDPIKAADLLELTVALHPAAVPPWLALFAIYRRESMARQYALLAQKFGASFADDAHWPTVQQLGREIDPDNVLYGALAPASDADAARANGALQQDVTDEWLGVQLDFNSSLLATELRELLVSGAAPGAPPLAASAG